MMVSRKNTVLPAVMILVAGLLLGACQSSGFWKPHIAPEDRIPLRTDGVHQGTAHSGWVSMYYRYAVERDPGSDASMLNIDARIQKIRFRVNAVSIHLSFLDTAGQIIDRKLIYASGYRTRKAWGATRSFVIPEGAAAIALTAHTRESRGHR